MTSCFVLPTRRSLVSRYALGFTLFLAAFGLRYGLFPVEARLAFATFSPAVVLTFFVCGVGPGAMVAALSVFAGLYFFSPPYYSLHADSAALAAAAAFLLAAAMTGWVVHRLRTASQALQAAHERLSVNERNLNAVVEGQTEMLFRFGKDGRFLFANSVGRTAFNLQNVSLQDRTWFALVMPEERAEVVERLKQFSPDRPTVKTETRFQGAQGETRWGEFVHHASFDTTGQLLEVQTVGRDVTERRLLQEQLAELSSSLQDLYDRAPCGYYSLNAQGVFVRVNERVLEWLGCSADDVVGKLGPRDFFTAESVAEFNKNFPEFLAQGHIGPLEFDLLSWDGTERRVSMSATALRDAAGGFVSSRSVMYDVTELTRARRDLDKLTRQQAAMLDNELIGIVKLKDRRAVWKNRALERMFGYRSGELDGQPARRLYADDESYAALGKAAYPALVSGNTYRTQLQMVRKDGQLIWVDVSGALVDAETNESMWMMLDITSMKQSYDDVEKVAFHDALTGLPNRLLLTDRLRQAIPLAARLKSSAAICFIDLDGFKAVNDRLGHAAGDQLLQVISQRLQQCVRGNDTVSRLGGDEFVLLLTNLQGREECDSILTRALQAIQQPVELADGVLGVVSASIGVALCPEHGTDSRQLLTAADETMYAVKRAGRGGVRYANEADEKLGQ